MVAAAGGGDDGDGDGALAAAAAAAAVEVVGLPAVVVAGQPEKLALQRPSCRHSTTSLRQSE